MLKVINSSHALNTVMNKNDTQIMTVPRKLLFRQGSFEGFCPAQDFNYLDLILNHYTWSRRGDAENNPEQKQPIGYAIIVQEETNKIFVYQRAPDQAYDEKRLRGKWSWGIGGHIDLTKEIPKNPVLENLMREINEEIHLQGPIKPYLLGYINEDQTDVGRVHFGVLYIMRTSSTTISPKDPEIHDGKFMTLAEAEETLANPSVCVESWSQIALAPCRDFLTSQVPLSKKPPGRSAYKSL